MSRAAGQVRTGEALLGALVIVLALAAVVIGAQALVPEPDHVALRAEPEQGAAAPPCPTPSETIPRPRPSVDAAAGPVPVTSAALLACPSAFDGRAVTFDGEVVRAVLRRGERAWVQLNDDAYGVAIGPLPRHHTPRGANSGMAVSIPSADADRISRVGGAHSAGDRLRVRGRFLRTHPADAGGPAIHADTVEILAVGRPVTRRVTPARIAVALLLGAAAIAMTRTARRSDR